MTRVITVTAGTVARRIIAVAFALVVTPLFAAGDHEASAGRVAVVATTNIVGDILSRIGGDRLSLYVMLPLGADPHVFQATPRDARQVADAAVVFTNGAGLEADFLGDLIANAATSRVVDLSAHLSLRRIEDAEGGHDDGELDPHVWMDPTLVAAWTVEIAEVLSAVDPDHAGAYSARAATLAGELDELDAWVREQVAAIPQHRRILMTDHGVFGYFADRYGFKVLDTVNPGFSTASEPSARHLAGLRDAITEHAVAAVFVGVTVNPQAAQAVTDDLGIEVVALYTGSLSQPDGPAATYQDFIRANVERIVAALVGME